jgi:hypothetical protein
MDSDSYFISRNFRRSSNRPTFGLQTAPVSTAAAVAAALVESVAADSREEDNEKPPHGVTTEKMIVM